MPPGHKNREWELHENATHSIAQYFQDMGTLIPQLPVSAIAEIASVFLCAVEDNRTIFIFGNGGSAASASHMMCDMNKGASDIGANRPRVMALTDNVPLISAWANDFGYERVFSEQLKTFVKPRDVAFAISTSGDSPNVLLALETAREYGALTAGIAGCRGGQMKDLCDVCAIVPSDNVKVVEDLHHAMLHSIFTAVREGLLSKAGKSQMSRAASF
jgi:D-sedoheptulose 7-phosphate isomerase